MEVQEVHFGGYGWGVQVGVAQEEADNDVAYEIQPMCEAFPDPPSYAVPGACINIKCTLIVVIYIYLYWLLHDKIAFGLIILKS